MYRIGQPEIDALVRVIKSKQLFKINDGAREVMNCEIELKEMMGADYALLMTSGTAALVCALVGLGIGPGDEVIIPAYTFIATAMAVTAVGAIPVITDIDSALTIDVKDIERNISKYTKAIIPVHMRGIPCDMDSILALAKARGIAVVEDACQAIGGSYKGRPLGSLGDAGAFSFNYFKSISTGEGGALITNDKKLYERALIHHDSNGVAFFGDQLKNVGEELFCGTEFRVSELTGALLRAQLGRLDELTRDLHAKRDALLNGIRHKFELAPSHDADGDSATTIALRFDSAETAKEFADRFGLMRPFDTNRHNYFKWKPILEKRGALNPLMDPFKMEANKNLNHNYSYDMCPKAKDFLSRTVYIVINPDWTDADIEDAIEKYVNA